jgi:hypothetical protein
MEEEEEEEKSQLQEEEVNNTISDLICESVVKIMKDG